MRFKHILALTVTAAVLLHGAPRAYAQSSEGDQKETLVNLLSELKADYASALDSDSLQVESRQYREDMAEMVKEANEMTLKLYSQNPEFSCDMAFALDDISALSQRFHDQVGFADKDRSAYRNGLRRYSLLGETLRGMYPVPVQDTLAIADSLVTAFIEPLPETQEDPVKYALLDSCLFYTDALTGMYEKSVDLTLQDSLLYANTEDRLKQAVEYAQSNYEDSQKSMYILENARVVQDQAEYRSRYNELVGKYESLKTQIEEKEQLISDNIAKSRIFDVFIKELKKQQGLVTEFDENLWCSLVESMTVYSKEKIVVRFKNGTEIVTAK